MYDNVWNFHYDWFTVTLWYFKTNLAYEPAKNPRYNIHCFDVLLIFLNWCLPYLPSWLVHFKCENCPCFTIKICNKTHTKESTVFGMTRKDNWQIKLSKQRDIIGLPPGPNVTLWNPLTSSRLLEVVTSKNDASVDRLHSKL